MDKVIERHYQASSIFRSLDSPYREKIKESLIELAHKRLLVTCFLYANLIAFITIFLCLNGMSVNAAAMYLLFSYGLLGFNYTLKKVVLPSNSSSRLNEVRLLISYIINDLALASILLFNAVSDIQAEPYLVVIAVVISTFVSLQVTFCSFIDFVVSKAIVFFLSLCVIFYSAKQQSELAVSFPILITFILLSILAYLIHVQKIRELHNESEQKFLYQQLTKESRLREKLFTFIGHDLRQPINALNYILLELSHQTQDSMHIDLINEGRSCVRSSNEYIDSILTLSKDYVLTPTIKKEHFSVNDVFSNIDKEYRSLIKSKSMSLRIVNCSQIIFSDAHLVSRILKNFISNAIKYAPHSDILMGVRRKQSGIEIYVIDQGDGINQEEQDKIFDTLYQIDQSSSGFGLGLDITRQLAQALGGYVALKSVVNKGASFYLYLPFE